MKPRRAVLATKVDDLQMEVVPQGAVEGLTEVFFHMVRGLSSTETPAVREPMNVGVHRERGHVERLGHHHVGRLASYTREVDQRVEVLGDGAVVLFNESLGHPSQGLVLLRREADLADDVADRLDLELGHGLGGGGGERGRSNPLIISSPSFYNPL